MGKFEDLREKYDTFRYKNYTLKREGGEYHIEFSYEIPGLSTFCTKWSFPVQREADETILRALAFHLGMAESISYWKCACPKRLIVDCGSFSEETVRMVGKTLL